MSLTLKPYPEYKSSALPWAPIIPQHWKTERAKHLFARMQRPVRAEDEVVTCFRDGTVTLRKNRRLEGFTESLKEIGYQGVRRGDLVIHAMDAFAGAVGVSDSDGKCTPVYSICQPKPGVDAYYYASIVREMGSSQWIAALARGIRERSTDFRYETFANELVPQPPADEQVLIAAFIRRIDATTRKVIRAKRRIIELLNEQKKRIVRHAVTRGLDDSARLKASGIPWIDRIPEDWERSRVKREFVSLNPRRVPLSSTQRGAMTARLYDYYGASGIIDKVDDYLFDDELLLLAEDGANLVNRNLPLAIIARGKFWVNNHAHILKPKAGNLEYLALLMETVDYRPWISGAAQPKLTLDRLMAIPIPVPPPAEQVRILSWVATQTERLNTALDRAKHEIMLLREYHTRFIADVVTGKLDVRGAELPVIEEAEEPETPEDFEGEEELVAGEESDDAAD